MAQLAEFLAKHTRSLRFHIKHSQRKHGGARLALRKRRQESQKFKVNLHYITSSGPGCSMEKQLEKSTIRLRTSNLQPSCTCPSLHPRRKALILRGLLAFPEKTLTTKSKVFQGSDFNPCNMEPEDFDL